MKTRILNTPELEDTKETSNLQDKSFENLMLEAGYPPVNTNYNAKLHRFGKNKKLWYFACDYYAICGDWSCNLPKVEWKSKGIAEHIIQQAKQNYEEEKLKGYKIAKVKSQKIYYSLQKGGLEAQPYLQKKKIENFINLDNEIRISESKKLVIPIKNIQGEITSLQFISESGEKRFLRGGEIKGCFHVVGNFSGEAYACEGYATALTIHAITKKAVIICFNALNIKAVTKAILSKYPKIKLTLAGDNDLHKPFNTGKGKCEEVSKELNLSYILPLFKNLESKPTDFNDLYVLEGKEAVLKILQKPYLKTFNFQELMETELPLKQSVLHPILKEGSLAMLYAKRGVGKTFVSLEVAFAVASGKDMFNGKWKAEKQRKVLFVDGEMPFETIKQRLTAIKNRNNAFFNPENLVIINPEVQEEGMPDLATKEGQALINEYITADTSLVILDNLSTLCRTGRENESESWNIIQEWILHLRRRNIAVLMIHHAGKNGEQRGNSKKEDILDTVINLKKPSDYEGSEGARFEVIYEKSRNFTGDEAKSFEAILTENGFIVKDLELGIKSKVLEFSKEGMSQRDIAKELAISLSKVNRILKNHKNPKKN